MRTCVFTIQPSLKEVVKLENKFAGVLKEWDETGHVLEIGPDDASSDRWFRGRRSPNYE